MTKNFHIGIIMNGVTGRMGTNQHLLRSLVPMIQQGGILSDDGENRLIPKLILVGRNEEKLTKLCEKAPGAIWTTSLDDALSREDFPVYFDAQITGRRYEAVKKAIEAGKHVYCEKPTGLNLKEAVALAKMATEKGIKHGVVQDKLWLPGLLKLKHLIDTGFFGRILSVRGEFGYWVFEGFTTPPNRPSWNYRKEDGGGIIADMLCHWRYVLDNLFGEVKSVSCVGATHIPKRVDEEGKEYTCTADDSAYATFQLEGDIIAHFNSSWAVRVRRDDLLTLQVDGSKGSAVAGLRDCQVQSYQNTPVPVWNPDIPQPIRFYDQWDEVMPEQPFENAFKAQWALFLKHVIFDDPFPWDLYEGAKGVQLAEKGIESWNKRKWIQIKPITE